MMEDQLRDRYFHLDANWQVEAELGIDIATPAAAKLLLGLAHETLKQAKVVRGLRRYLGSTSA